MSRLMIAAETESYFQAARREILSSGGELQMLSDVARQALEAADDPNCVIADVASLVERDTRLTADVLTMANSAAFATNVSIVSLHQAVARLGLEHCKNLIPDDQHRLHDAAHDTRARVGSRATVAA